MILSREVQFGVVGFGLPVDSFEHICFFSGVSAIRTPIEKRCRSTRMSSCTVRWSARHRILASRRTSPGGQGICSLCSGALPVRIA